MNKNNEKHTYIILHGCATEDKQVIIQKSTIECIPDEYADRAIRAVVESTQDKLKPFVFAKNIQLTSDELQQLTQAGVNCYNNYFEWVADYLQETRFTAEFLHDVYHMEFANL